MRNMKDLYDATKKLAGNFRQTSQQIKDKNGKVLTTTEEQLARWVEHFKELLNRPPPDVTPEINRADEELKINLNLPSKTEIKQAIKKLKTTKASGPDNIPPEALKANPDLIAEAPTRKNNEFFNNNLRLNSKWLHFKVFRKPAPSPLSHSRYIALTSSQQLASFNNLNKVIL